MRISGFGLWLLVAVLAADGAAAQSTSGTISGRVVDGQGRTAPGVTITAQSPALQGTQTVVTSENGDFIVTQLPPGLYTVSFELDGFATERRSVNLAPTQLVRVDVELGPASVETRVDVTAPSVDVLTQTTQVGQQLQAGPDRDAARDPGHHDRSAAGARGSPHRPGRQLLDLRGDDVREPLHGQRSHGDREHQGTGPAEPDDRGCDPGDHDCHRRHCGRIRTVRRRRGQRRHQVGRQFVQRILSRHAQQRQLASAGSQT